MRDLKLIFFLVDLCSWPAESGQLVAGIAINNPPAYYAITLSTSPFSGDLFLKTIKDDFLYFKGKLMHARREPLIRGRQLYYLPFFFFTLDPSFVNMYEHGQFYYLFMREEGPVESSAQVSLHWPCPHVDGDHSCMVFQTFIYLYVMLNCQQFL